ncbi:J domain-containing protein [bacterium]|nr:J domain-containing protein [bacterium]
MIVWSAMLLLRKVLFILAIYFLFYYLKKIFLESNKTGISASQNDINAAYRDLNLQPNASLEEVKSQYRTLSKQYHPDTNVKKKQNAEKMQNLNAAYALLKKHLKNT